MRNFRNGKRPFCPSSSFGLPDEMIEKGKEAKSISEIVQNGNSFKVTVTTGTKVLVNEFTIGEEAELQTPTGEKIKGVVTKEGENKLKVNLKGIESVTELCGDKIINTMTVRGIAYKRISKRI
ncbi:fatty acid-binding protein 1, liver-like isoform X2 [Polypterus senegalus]|uniref:fatty acid-binding protein 1, liver-like isoform X2 n=1 Tax=Polypterus senegalus TaxID=55291 RepID=UPI00196653B9|nr:fatty acid-binding protein 1, liver-like isoform X2 [Polypterus senegalus]